MNALRWAVAVVTPVVFTVVTATVAGPDTTVPVHVLTGMHELCYGTKCYHRPQEVPLNELAPWLDWALADAAVTEDARREKIHTYAYLDPSIQYDPNHDYAPLYSDDESTFLRSCDGSRAAVKRGDLGGFLMDQGAAAYRARVRAYVDEHVRGRYDALFVDDVYAAVHTYATVVRPACARSYERERDATFALWSHLSIPVIFNGLGDAPDDGSTETHAQAALEGPGAIGGMYEFCTSTSDNGMDNTLANKRVDGAWRSAENSHLQTVARDKLFLCYAGSDTPGDSDVGRAERAYVYSSFLLVYRPKYSVLEMTASSARKRVSVFPEATVLALGPLRPQPADVDDLRAPSGAYVREYARCFVRAVPVGPCAAVVNASRSRTVDAAVHGYKHALEMHGGALLEGGTVTTAAAPPARLPAASGTVLFR